MHPHPLYGGDMVNPVVETLATAYNKKGYTTLRFNFRGVGDSEGIFDDGNGEQQDILAAVSYLIGQGMTSIHLAGYSFGAWVLGKTKEFPDEVTGQVLVSPPLAMLPFEEDLSLPLLKLVVTGEEDEFAPAELIRDFLESWNPRSRFEVIDHADHFYYGSFGALEKVVRNFLSADF